MREHKFRHCNFWIRILQLRSAYWNNYSLLSPLLKLLKKRKTVFGRISNIKRSLLNQNDSIIAETLLFESNGLNYEENAWIIDSTSEYIVTTERFISPLLWIHLSKSSLFLKSLIDSESPYVILFICLVVQFFLYINFIFNDLLNVYHQNYVLICNLFSLIFFSFLLCISNS